jgi:hypothetical protein
LEFEDFGGQELALFPLGYIMLHRDLVAFEQSREGEEEDKSQADGANYQPKMMCCPCEMDVDNNTVGWYDCPKQGPRMSSFMLLSHFFGLQVYSYAESERPRQFSS